MSTRRYSPSTIMAGTGELYRLVIVKNSSDERLDITMEQNEDGPTVVRRLGEAGLAARAGVALGDEVVCIDGVTVESPVQASKLIATAEGCVEMRVKRRAPDGPAGSLAPARAVIQSL
jgi:C-terminal processing protease CtpA/Prc